MDASDEAESKDGPSPCIKRFFWVKKGAIFSHGYTSFNDLKSRSTYPFYK